MGYSNRLRELLPDIEPKVKICYKCNTTKVVYGRTLKLECQNGIKSELEKSMTRFIAWLEKIANRPCYLVLVFVGVLVVSASFYAQTEGKNFFDGIWWTFVTAYTVGYGDQYPVSLAGRIAAIVLMSLMIIVRIRINREHLC